MYIMMYFFLVSKCEEILQIILHLITFMVCGAISIVCLHHIHIVYVIVGVHSIKWCDAEKNTPANGLHHNSRKKAAY